MALLAPMPSASVSERRGGERRRAPHHAERVAEVLFQLGPEFRAIHVSSPSFVDGHALLPRAIEISESLERQLARALRRLALVDQLANPHLDMKGELRLDVGFRLEAEHPAEPRPARHRLLERRRVQRREHRCRIAVPVGGFGAQLRAAAPRQRIELGLAIVFGGAPARG